MEPYRGKVVGPDATQPLPATLKNAIAPKSSPELE